ncbi:MAG: DUF2309 domain-containing protein [Chlamydiia bacterium]|nr:DUF2309 domain-containing protein [Chlamydiia bacterium]
MAPFWPLKNLVAVNPMAGFEELPFEEALKQAEVYFQQKELPEGMLEVNRESIKWLQAFFDEGQSTLSMPNRHLGFLGSILRLLPFDHKVHKKKWLSALPKNPKALIAEGLRVLKIPHEEHERFLTLLLTTLPGWASYAILHDPQDYLAFRLLLTCLLYPKAKELLSWHDEALKNADADKLYQEVVSREAEYRASLLAKLESGKQPPLPSKAKAQLVFCIDVRSEALRRALEAQGEYETFGFAGFFGVPTSVENGVTGERHASCPVLLKPAHTVVEQADRSSEKGWKRLQGVKKLYQSLKYTFATPFALVEALGPLSGLWMGIKCLSPEAAAKIRSSLKRTLAAPYALRPHIESIPLEQQIAYGANALKIMGLTEFAPLIVFCGHRSATENNAHRSALDCGACGGRPGGPNARILAALLNSPAVKEALSIPEETLFVAAEHITTTGEVELFAADTPEEKADEIAALKEDLRKASQRLAYGNKKANDWSEVRPEWGLANNAAFIVAPRWFTKKSDLEGRAFLHSYDWEKDSDGSSLTAILTAPMVVAQWINAQYFFSTFDNVAFGGGSKVTQNITGKVGVMQGNASDLMHGLPLQSVFNSDGKAFHTPIRLTVVVYAPKNRLDPIIDEHPLLQKLFGNGWVHLICINPN